MPLPTLVIGTTDAVERAELESALTRIYELHWADNNVELIQLVERHLPDAILMAHDFGGAGRGIVVCRQLHAMPRTRSIGLIAICPRRVDGRIPVGERGGPDDVLLKPLQSYEVRWRIEAVRRMRRYAEKLADGSHVDPLTSTYSRGYLLERLAYELKRAARYGRCMALAVVDLDHFGKLNNDYGTELGDMVLQETGRLLCSRLRGVDLVARSGEDEFSILLPETSLLVARPIAERLCQALEQYPIGAEKVTIAASIGVSGVPHPELKDSLDLLRAARTALARARERGGGSADLY
jgi:two-component system cell cycle response regulator